MARWSVIALCLLCGPMRGEGSTKPNIIVILADDMGEIHLQRHCPCIYLLIFFLGINDVSWNNPLADTPFLGNLSMSGIILDNAYTLPVCSPSRAAVLTGVYPFKMGLQVSLFLLFMIGPGFVDWKVKLVP